MYFDLSMQFHCIMTTNVLQASVGILFISFLSVTSTCFKILYRVRLLLANITTKQYNFILPVSSFIDY